MSRTNSEMLKKDYTLLGVPFTAEPEAIRRAWRLQVQAWHPDKFRSETDRAYAEEQTKNLNAAYDRIKDAPLRNAPPPQEPVAEDAGTSVAPPSPPTPHPAEPEPSLRHEPKIGLARWFFIIGIIVVIVVALGNLFKTSDNHTTPGASTIPTRANAPSVLNLQCENGFHKPLLTRQVILTVPPSNCWTVTLLRPRDGNGNLSPNFFSDPDAEIRVRRFFEDGTSDGSDGIVDSPLVWRKNHGPRIVARQYKNTGNKPVTIRLTLW